MLKTRMITVGVLVAVITGVSVVLLHEKSPNKDTPGTGSPVETNDTTPEVIVVDDPSIRKEIKESGIGFHSGDTMTYLGSDYSEETPLIELSFQIKKLDGCIEPLKVAHLGLKRAGWNNSYEVEGITLRLQLGSNQVNNKTLLFGKEYTTTGIFPLGDHSEYEFSGNTRGVKMKVPDEVGPGKVCRINMVLIDEIREKELHAKKEAEKIERERIAEEEKITVTFEELPSKSLVVLYKIGDHEREAPLTDLNSKCVEMKGPNKLGGELAVFRADSSARCWAYIKNLQKRDITLPKDADIICNMEDLVDLTIKFQDKDVDELVKQKAVAFYASPQAMLPLFGISLRSKLPEIQADAPKELTLKIKPGTYYARVGEPMKDGIQLGAVTFNETGPNTWELKLP